MNFGILPLEFTDEQDYEDICQGDVIEMEHVADNLERNEIQAKNQRSGHTYKLHHTLSGRQIETIKAGGLLRQAGLE